MWIFFLQQMQLALQIHRVPHPQIQPENSIFVFRIMVSQERSPIKNAVFNLYLLAFVDEMGQLQ